MIEIRKLYKRYGKDSALDGLNLEIKKGSLFGFVGPNGAGKTTTMKIIAGLLKADEGQVFVSGIDAIKHHDQIKERIGYMPDFFGVYDNLKVIEYMEFYASIYGLDGAEAHKICMELLESVNLLDKTEQYVDSLSRGVKQRLCLARSLVHNPEVLLLDEPASNLDPRARYELKEILRNLCKRGKTIIISTHILQELSELCTHIGIINNGKTVASGTVESILAKLNSTNSLIMQFTKGQDIGIRLMKANPLIENISISQNNVSVNFNGGTIEESKLLELLVKEGCGISSYYREKSNLESLFMQLTGGV